MMKQYSPVPGNRSLGSEDVTSSSGPRVTSSPGHRAKKRSILVGAITHPISGTMYHGVGGMPPVRGVHVTASYRAMHHLNAFNVHDAILLKLTKGCSCVSINVIFIALGI